jgi:hypothetical protein
MAMGLISFSPRHQGAAVVYSYGEWLWLGHSQNQWYRIFPTLFWATPGTLGQQEIVGEDPFGLFRNAYPEYEYIEIEVSSERIRALLERLDREFNEGRATLHYSADYDMNFVKVPRGYHGFRNCNHVTVEWLRQLGLGVRQRTLFSKWKVVGEG